MLKLTELAPPETLADDVLTLPFEARQKSRLPACTDGGVKVGLFLQRGQYLRSGVVLTGTEKFNVMIKAAPESLSVVHTDDALLFARACYHLGNRHIALQIMPGELRFLSDHVLDHLVEGLGLTVTHEDLPFEPEAGAYHGHGH
ncbi:MAG: urease accessory protein UreE [Methylovulum sp.]|uniref:urease accessory protein UreE n=1 Tax=Methylovulum sp. TaxID=1916980 RepID=UPI00262096FA|nr:urease accessory protein UreE [Methylovulum sp.]MDD2722542.1 urease accessory protein UreE [Methylovulum sp.]MDD5123070.1 urease accessory protein UreE [Methylovulum sp.]